MIDSLKDGVHRSNDPTFIKTKVDCTSIIWSIRTCNMRHILNFLNILKMHRNVYFIPDLKLINCTWALEWFPHLRTENVRQRVLIFFSFALRVSSTGVLFMKRVGEIGVHYENCFAGETRTRIVQYSTKICSSSALSSELSWLRWPLELHFHGRHPILSDFMGTMLSVLRWTEVIPISSGRAVAVNAAYVVDKIGIYLI